MMWLAQGYGPSYRTINRFRVHPDMTELLRQWFVQFRSQLVEEKWIDQEAIFIDGTKIEANANKFTFVRKESVERHHATLIEKSNTLYDELLEHQIIPEIKRENDEQLSIKALSEVAHHLEEETAAIYRQRKIDVEPWIFEGKFRCHKIFCSRKAEGRKRIWPRIIGHKFKKICGTRIMPRRIFSV